MSALDALRAESRAISALLKAARYTPGEERARADGSVWKKPEDGGDLVMVHGPTSRGGVYGSPSPRRPRRNESPHGHSRLRTDGWTTTARWGAGHQDWPDDDPSAPWNEPIRWTSQQNDGAYWYPTAYSLDSGHPGWVVFRNGFDLRNRGMYSVAPMVAPSSLSSTGYLSSAERVPGPAMHFANQKQVRAYLRDHWRMNHEVDGVYGDESDGARLARSLREDDVAKAKAAEDAARHAAWQREQAEANRWRAEENQREADRKASDRATGKWMDRHDARLKPVQRAALLAAMAAEGLPASASWDVHDRAVVYRSAVGKTWPDAYRFAAMKVRFIREQGGAR